MSLFEMLTRVIACMYAELRWVIIMKFIIVNIVVVKVQCHRPCHWL
jgi:hypothetical protein